MSRWLKQLDDEGILKKVEDGYKLVLKPKAYQTFDYLNELRQKYGQYTYEGEVGKTFSHVCASTYLNFDELLIHETDEKIAFDIISVRLGELFGALYQLKNDILKRRCGLKQLKLDDAVMRETIFGLLNQSVGSRHATEELAKEYYTKLRQIEKKQFDILWDKNKPQHGFDRLDTLNNAFVFDNIEESYEEEKQSLKNDYLLDIEKYTIEDLIEKYREINDWIQRNHKEQLEKEHHYSLTPQEQEAERNYRTAILVKVTECIKALDTSTEDFAVILTRHPNTMNQYFTEEHILYEAMEWAREPPKEQMFKKFWQEVRDEEKTFEGMVAEKIVYYNNLNPKVIESLKSKPWVKKELSKYGSFDEILRLYKLKLKKRLKRDAEDAKRILGMIENICEESSKMKSKKNGI